MRAVMYEALKCTWLCLPLRRDVWNLFLIRTALCVTVMGNVLNLPVIRTAHLMRTVLFLLGMLAMSCAMSAQVRITLPNGGEVLQAGGAAFVDWTGYAALDTAQLDYSTNGGVSWNLIVKGLVGTGTYRWTPIPNVSSTSCRVRVQLRGPAGTQKVLYLKNPADPTPGNGNCATFTPDGRYAIVGDDKGTISIYDATSGALLAQRYLNLYGVMRVSCNRAGTWVAALTDADSVYVLNIPDLSTKFQWYANIPRQAVPREDRGLDVNPRDERIAVGGFRRTAIFSADGVELNSVPVITNGSNTWVEWLPDDQLIVASGATDRMVIVNPFTMVVERSWTGTGRTFKAWGSADGRSIYSTGKNLPHITRWDRFNTALSDNLYSGTIGALGIAMYADGSILRAFYGPPSTYEHNNGTTLSPIDTLISNIGGGDEIDIHPDQQRVLATYSSGGVIIFPKGAATLSEDISDANFTIQGTVVPQDSVVLIAIDTIVTTTRRDMKIPIRLLKSDTAAKNLQGYEVKFSFNSTMMVITDPLPGTLLNERMTITVSVPSSPLRENILAEISAHTALGTDSATDIRIDTVIAVGATPVIEVQHGRLVLTDICRAGGARMVNGAGRANVIVQPSVVGDVAQMEIAVVENGYYLLRVVDVRSNIVATKTFYVADASEISFDNNVQQIERGSLRNSNTVYFAHQFDCAEFGSGLYYVQLLCPSQNVTTTMQVVR
ncbi:MAG: WD40 repeat domain-containing protein [Ignavibacteria bacterium]|nr:WD40 repeat domain-containing protein [Ignavibacteria bacterium]